MNLTVAGDMVDLNGSTGDIMLLGDDLATYPADKFGTVALAAAQGITTVNNTAEAALVAIGNTAPTTFNFATGVVGGADAVNAVLTYTGFTSYVASDHGDTVTLTATGQEAFSGPGTDTFNVTGGAVLIHDLDGTDVLDVAAGAAVNATVFEDWTASSATVNNGDTTVDAAGSFVNVLAATGTAGWKLINSGGGANLAGSANNDTISGGAGDDGLLGGPGADTLNGGGGFDYASYRTAAAGLTVSLANPASNTGDAAGDTYTGIERLEGSEFNDTLTGDNFDNTLRGRGGADALAGGSGFDTASYFEATTGVTASLANPGLNTGEAAGDTYNSIEGLSGSGHNDVLTGNANDNSLSGNGGADALDGGGGFDYAGYNNAPAAVVASLADPSFNLGEAAGDTYTSIEGLRGSSFNDTLFGDTGHNWLEGRGGADVLNGGAGSDTASYFNATAGLTASLANPAANTGEAAGDSYTSIENIGGSRFNDTLVGDAGSNVLLGQGGADTLMGGDGFDFASYANAGAGVLASLGTPSANTGEALGDTYDSIENLIGSNFNDQLGGDSGNNRLLGGFGSDRLFGGAGNDEFWGNSQETKFDGAGDTIDYSIATGLSQGISVVWGTGTITGDAAIGTDTFLGIETIFGTSLADTFDSSGLTSSTSTFATDFGMSNFFRGGGGNDTITGNFATELLYDDSTAGITVTMSNTTQWAGTVDGIAGGVGTDSFTGARVVIGTSSSDVFNGGNFRDIFDGNSGGDDSYFGGAGSDSVEYDGSTRPAIVVNLGAGTVTSPGGTGPIGVDTLRSIEQIRGSNQADVFDASTFTADNAATPSVNAGSGSPFNGFEGYGGADTITGNNFTALQYFNASAAVSVTMSSSGAGTASTFYSTTVAASHTFTGVAQVFGSNFNDSFVGSSGIDNFFGQSGNDTLQGNDGADRLTGGLGNDTMTGGAQNDVFVFDTALNGTTNVDTINDFASGSDKVELNRTAFTALTAGSLGAAAFATAGAETSTTRVVYNAGNGDLSYDFDGSGAGAAVKFATLVGVPAIANTDFIVV